MSISGHHSDHGSFPGRLAAGGGLKMMSEAGHFVQFYEQDDFLQKSVGKFVSEAFQTGSAAVVIATGAHRNALENVLNEQGFDAAKLKTAGFYYSLDAAETLGEFMVGGHPDPFRFNQVVGSVIAKASREGTRVRAFGEMVALLWAQGNGAAALALEDLWNDLAKRHSFLLCCAYAIGEFGDAASTEAFTQICEKHSRVLPAESCSELASNVDENLRSIAILQQKAAALEAEMARRKTIEEVLAREKRELSDFLENASEAIHKVGADGRIIWANAAELELLGYIPDEYIGHPISEFHADPEIIQDILERLARREKLHDYEARLKHKDGSVRYVSINSSVHWENDRFVHTKCFTRDITDRKRATELLEKAVEERTSQLQEVVGELETFSYSVSHDLRTPLRAMQGYAKSLLEDYGSNLDSEAISRLHRIERAGQRLDTLVRDILTYSRVSKGELNMQPLRLDVLIGDILNQHGAVDPKSADITIEQLHAVLGHEAYVTQCLTNLIDNALKFVAPARVPVIKIGSEEVGDYVRVYVKDYGIGIDPAHRQRIFRMFERVHPEKTYPGTGIGLAIVKKAVSRMGGEVGFESEPGRGSTFWFTLLKAGHN
jgi:PAS domain S-box-containing protein